MVLDFSGDYAYTKSMTIAWREMLVVVVSLAVFGPLLKNQRVAMHVDNEFVRYFYY